MNSAAGLPGGRRKAWAKDRLLNIDEKTYSYTYAVEGSNMNLDDCQITFRAAPDGKDGSSTIVTWAWEADPIKKSTKEKTLSDMSEFGCTFIKGLEAAATDSVVDFNREELTRRSTAGTSSMPTLGGPELEIGDLDYELEAALKHVSRPHEVESKKFGLESATSHGVKKADFTSGLSPLRHPYGFAGGGVIIDPQADELVQLEAEVGSLLEG